MKSASARLVAGVVLAASCALPACDGARLAGDTTPGERKAVAEAGPAPTSAPEAEGLAAVRARADAAFAALDPGRIERSRTRIGPQPWPRDLPAAWPRLDPARVVADSVRPGRGRLLLVDVPGAPEHALESLREALDERGFETRRPERLRAPIALHAWLGDDDVVLTFHDREYDREHDRERHTRLEILFVEPASG